MSLCFYFHMQFSNFRNSNFFRVCLRWSRIFNYSIFCTIDLYFFICSIYSLCFEKVDKLFLYKTSLILCLCISSGRFFKLFESSNYYDYAFFGRTCCGSNVILMFQFIPDCVKYGTFKLLFLKLFCILCFTLKISDFSTLNSQNPSLTLKEMCLCFIFEIGVIFVLDFFYLVKKYLE
jgi:hypothetical protein